MRLRDWIWARVAGNHDQCESVRASIVDCDVGEDTRIRYTMEEKQMGATMAIRRLLAKQSLTDQVYIKGCSCLCIR